MNDVTRVVTHLFVSTDQGNWAEVQNCFADKVMLDYSSFSGNPAAELAPQEIVKAWQSILPGFEHTHHQIGNLQSTINGDRATVFCYGTATHYLTDDGGNIWTVVGSYDFDLIRSGIDGWKITSMTFHFKYQDGNSTLPEKAMNNL